MEVTVRRTVDEFDNVFETLLVDGVRQFKIGPITGEEEFTCEMLMILLEKAWDAGVRKDPMVPIYQFEPLPREKRFDTNDFAY